MFKKNKRINSSFFKIDDMVRIKQTNEICTILKVKYSNIINKYIYKVKEHKKRFYLEDDLSKDLSSFELFMNKRR